MIIGVGVDIIEIARMKRAIHSERFIKRIFTPLEQKYCYNKHTQAASCFAARFAAKEALAKAFGTGIGAGRWLDIEVINNSMGAPQIQLAGTFAELQQTQNIKYIHLSLSHCRDYAMAQVILEV